MHNKISILCAFVLLSACNKETVTTKTANQPVIETSGQSSYGRTPLADLVNRYRVRSGLEKIPVSVSLTRVAEAHVLDLESNSPGGDCDLHSWSDKGEWSACCYTSDHAKSRCMWDKPKEITQQRYNGNGYEVAAFSSGAMTAEGALDIWKESSDHQDVILNRGIWAENSWQALGAAVSAHYAVVWFGHEIDPDGALLISTP